MILDIFSELQKPSGTEESRVYAEAPPHEVVTRSMCTAGEVVAPEVEEAEIPLASADHPSA